MDQSVQTLIDAVEKADSADKLRHAVAILSQHRHEAAIPTLSAVLGYNNPGASVIAVDGLIALGESAVLYLLDNLDGYNYGARAWATRVFAGVGDPRALDLLIESALIDFSLSVRRAAARGLGTIRWDWVADCDRKSQQQQVLETLIKVSEDGEWVVRYAAIVGLESLAKAQPEFYDAICDRFQQILTQDEELALRARVKKAQIELLS